MIEACPGPGGKAGLQLLQGEEVGAEVVAAAGQRQLFPQLLAVKADSADRDIEDIGDLLAALALTHQ